MAIAENTVERAGTETVVATRVPSELTLKQLIGWFDTLEAA